VIRLIVGLGNPGQKYLKTRHNAGFLLLDEILSQCGGDFSAKPSFLGCLAEVNESSHKVYLLRPSTYMNRSGQSVQAVMKYFKIKPEEVLVIHDELDFLPGQIKFKLGGGHGGHNGLRDIIAAINGRDFLRLRVGIGRPSGSKAVVDYVLSDFSKSDYGSVISASAGFLDVLPFLVSGELEKAIQKLHS